MNNYSDKKKKLLENDNAGSSHVSGRATRGFGLLNKFTNDPKAPKNLRDWPTIPQRATPGSAGYDIRANETIMIPSMIKNMSNFVINNLKNLHRSVFSKIFRFGNGSMLPTVPFTPTAVHTGIKAYMIPKGEALMIYNRSSNPSKRGLYLANGVGVVDQDYYSNKKNDGELVVSLINLSAHNYMIHRGDRIAQGVFEPWYRADIDMPMNKHRQGGFGSTGKK